MYKLSVRIILSLFSLLFAIRESYAQEDDLRGSVHISSSHAVASLAKFIAGRFGLETHYDTPHC